LDIGANDGMFSPSAAGQAPVVHARDGDGLGLIITKLPQHGVLTTTGGRRVDAMAAVDGGLTYTADFGHEGNDQLEFMALDGQGLSAKSWVQFEISSTNVPVLVYEGFNYP